MGLGNRLSVVVGASHFCQSIGEKMLLYPSLGYHLVGFIDDKKPKKINYHLREGKFIFLGKTDDFTFFSC